MNSLKITPTSHEQLQDVMKRNDSSTGKAYAKGGKDFRFVTKLSLDPETNRDLIAVQYLNDLKTASGNRITRTTIIRRAVRLYTQQLLQAHRGGVARILDSEKATLLSMARNRKPSTITGLDVDPQ
jgi:hypothetical protein